MPSMEIYDGVPSDATMPMGYDLILDQIRKHPRQPNLKILDTRCGEGEYLKWLSQVVPEADLTGLDPDFAKLKAAREAMGDNPKVQFVMGSITKNQLHTKFDIILVNQLMVQLDQKTSIGENAQIAVQRLCFFLENEGCIIVNLTEYEQRTSYWFAPVIKNACEESEKYLPTAKMVKRWLQTCGCSRMSSHKVTDYTFDPEMYSDPKSLEEILIIAEDLFAKSGHVEVGAKLLKKLCTNQSYFQGLWNIAEEARLELGQSTSIVGWKK